MVIVMSKNFLTVDEIVVRIQNELSSSVNSWREIAKLIYTAKEQYFSEGGDNSDYKAILNKTGFHPKTALKLSIVGKAVTEGDVRLGHEMLQDVHSWTVLYDVLTLNDEQFGELATKIEADKKLEKRASVTRAVIKRIKDGPTQIDDYVTVFTVRVDANAIRTGRFSDEAYGEMLELLQSVQPIPYARVDATAAYSTRNEAWVKAYNDKIDELKGKQVTTCISALGKSFASSDDEFDVAEWSELAKVDADGFYDEVRSYCPELQVLSTSEIAEDARRFLDQRFQKVNVNEPFANANNSIVAANSNDKSEAA